MSLSTAYFLGLAVLLALMAALDSSLRTAYKKFQEEAALYPADRPQPRLTSKQSFGFGLFHLFFDLYVIAGAVYLVWIRTLSPWFGALFVIAGFFLSRKPLQLVRSNLPHRPEKFAALPLQPRSTDTATAEMIFDLLHEPSVIDAIKRDLGHTRQVRGKEQWRLGVLDPSCDIFDLSYFQLTRQERMKRATDHTVLLNMSNRIPLWRTAILHSTAYFGVQYNNLMVLHGATQPLINRYPGWSYRLKQKLPSDQYITIRDVEISTDSLSAASRNPCLPRFLQEDGFPLKDVYMDGDPLTTERGGTIVIDKGRLGIIRPEYFVQSRIIDNEGNLVYMGLDENFGASSTWDGISVVPSLSKKLYKSVEYNGYTPVLRYRSFPYASELMLPLIDTPLSDSGWADLFIDTRGKGMLYIAKRKTLEEWTAMMEKLHGLFNEVLTRRGYHLLAITKDPSLLEEYFGRKALILADCFIIREWALP